MPAATLLQFNMTVTMTSLDQLKGDQGGRDLRSARVVLGPDGDELSQVVRPENGRVPGQVVEVVHDDGHEEVEHDERAQEDEGDKVDVGQGGATVLAWVEQPT